MKNIYRLSIITVIMQLTLLVYAVYLKPLPVAGQPDKPVLVLTGAPLEKGVIPEPSTQLYGATVINKDAERIDVNDSKIILVRGGWGKSGVTLRYVIDMTATPTGKYSFWTAYTLGGKSEQNITVRVGKDGNNLETRLSISQSNVESWKTTWQLAPGDIALKSTDTVLEIAISGNGADRKIIDSFLLSPIGLLPADAKAAGTVYDLTHHLMPLPIEGTVDNQLILLEAEPLAKDITPDPLMISYGGNIINNTGERVVTAGKTVTVFNKGWANTAITLQYKLDTQAKPGRYQIWTAFTNGGKSTHTFIIRAGKDTQHLTEKMNFSQPNADSWKTMWQKSAGMLTLLPGEQVVEVEIKGMSADQKIIDAFLLSPAEIFPQKITAESTRLRLLLPSLPQGATAQKYVYILDNPESEKSEVMLKGLTSDKLHDFWLTTQSVYLWGSKSKEMANLLHINHLPQWY